MGTHETILSRVRSHLFLPLQNHQEVRCYRSSQHVIQTLYIFLQGVRPRGRSALDTTAATNSIFRHRRNGTEGTQMTSRCSCASCVSDFLSFFDVSTTPPLVAHT